MLPKQNAPASGMRPNWADWVVAKVGAVADIVQLPADAGRRTHYRVRAVGRTLVLAHAPAGVDRQAMPRFIEVQSLLSANGVRVPEILAVHHGLGLILMSDLGEATMRDVLTRDADGPFTEVYRILRQFRTIPVESIAFPRVTLDDLVAECAPLFDYYLPQRFGGRTIEEFRGEMRAICTRVAAQPAALQHRDLHARNLVCDEAGRVGVVDFQDAAHTSCYVDLAAVVFDQNFARGRAEIDQMVAESFRYLRVLPDGRAIGFEEYRAELAYAGVYWLLRLLGVCARLVRRDGKHGFLAEIRNSLHHLPIATASWRLIPDLLVKLLTDSPDSFPGACLHSP